MTEATNQKRKAKDSDGEGTDPVQVVRKGAIAASIWRRQAPSGFAYYDFTLSRSWKSMSTEKTGYSKSFFDKNSADLIEVITRASEWIAANQESQPQPLPEGESLAA